MGDVDNGESVRAGLTGRPPGPIFNQLTAVQAYLVLSRCSTRSGAGHGLRRYHYEQANVPAEQPSACQSPRLPSADAHARRPRHPRGTTPQGAHRALRLNRRDTPRRCWPGRTGWSDPTISVPWCAGGVDRRRRTPSTTGSIAGGRLRSGSDSSSRARSAERSSAICCAGACARSDGRWSTPAHTVRMSWSVLSPAAPSRAGLVSPPTCMPSSTRS